MSELSEVKQELAELRKVVNKGFADMAEWKKETEIALRGQDQDDVWGYNQKFKHLRESYKEHETRILTLEINWKKMVAWVLGAGSGAGLIGGIVFNIILQLL